MLKWNCSFGFSLSLVLHSCALRVVCLSVHKRKAAMHVCRVLPSLPVDYRERRKKPSQDGSCWNFSALTKLIPRSSEQLGLLVLLRWLLSCDQTFDLIGILHTLYPSLSGCVFASEFQDCEGFIQNKNQYRTMKRKEKKKANYMIWKVRAVSQSQTLAS